MKKRIQTFGLLALLALPLTASSFADEGMFPMSELARLDLKSRGIELTADQLFNASELSLVDGVCRVNGCTGSFVSDKGLIITNHHCAYDAIQKASTKERDLLADGFNAKTLADEIPAPDYQVRVTEDYRDVSQDVLSAVSSDMSNADRKRAIEKRSKELEAQAEKVHPGLRAEVSEMFAGKTYVLFLYTYLRDVRLVFAPPQSVGNFGGEVDNWEWPRHTGDFSFMRAYVSPDGKSATYAKENIPYKPKRVIAVAPQGVDEGDTVFLLGYPGRTARHKTASFLEFEQNIRLPTIVQLYQWQIDTMLRAGKDDRAVEIKHASRIRSLANVEKRSRGQLKGLTRAQIAATRAKEEMALQSFIDRDPTLKAKYGRVLADIREVYSESTRSASFEIHFDQLRSAVRGLAAAFFIVDAAHERTKPNLDRESAYTERNFSESVQKLKVAMSDFHAPTEAIMLSGLLARLAAIPESHQIKGLAESIKDPSKFDSLAEKLTASTRLYDPTVLDSLLATPLDQLKATSDPLIQWMLELYPTYTKLREADKAREGRLGQLYGALVDVKQLHLATQFIPDANGTLRLTSGRVRAYSPEDAIIKTPISTLRGVVEKTTGVEPFVTPKAVLEKYGAGQFGPFKNAKLGDVPVAILYDTDTTGGNSGSPVFNKRGELVGVNFDRCFEATINDFAWNTNYSRSIGVDIRYVLWITGIVYDAKHLLAEMHVPID